jgi:hypothetical protein
VPAIDNGELRLPFFCQRCCPSRRQKLYSISNKVSITKYAMFLPTSSVKTLRRPDWCSIFYAKIDRGISGKHWRRLRSEGAGGLESCGWSAREKRSSYKPVVKEATTVPPLSTDYAFRRKNLVLRLHEVNMDIARRSDNRLSLQDNFNDFVG